MNEPTATRPGVGNRRMEVMAEIIKTNEALVDEEMKASGSPDGISVLERGGSAQSAIVKPEGVDQAEWDALDAEGKAGVAEADAERVKLEEEAAAAEQQTEEPPKADAQAAPTGKKVKIKVDGQEMEVDESVLLQAGIKTMQKETAADKRLEEASRLFKEAQTAIAAAQAGAVQNTNSGGASLPHEGGGAADVLTDQAFTDAVKKIQYGSEAEAAATLKDLITKAARAGQPEQLTLERVSEMLDFRDATTWAHDEYKDILGDPKLKSLFSQEEKRVRAAGDMRPYREVYKDIGDGLRDWLKERGVSQIPPKDTSLNARRERKASVVTIQSAAARREAAPQPKEASPSETIDKMRERRDRQAGRLPMQ